MAEALVDLADPLESVLSPGPERPVSEVLGVLARSVAPAESDRAAPEWLRPEQVAPFRRVMAALERHGGALLADPVGSGKTWIALAVAARYGEAVAVIPAALREQWRRAARAAGVPVRLHSHETLSRGRVPDRGASLVIVDESHRFRTPTTRRYRALARWLVGKRVLLLSATPVVNRLADLAHQLRLGVRDDALAPRGVPNLFRLLSSGRAAPALGDVVLARPEPPRRPAVSGTRLEWEPDPVDLRLLAAIDGLALSRERSTRALIRMVLWRALASSRAALARTLARYERLLAQAAHAAAGGQPVTRAEIRRFAGGELDQMVMWELLPSQSPAADLAPEDHTRVERLVRELAQAADDARGHALQRYLSDGRVTLAFTTSRDTHTWLRQLLAPLRPAWATGSAAGIGHTRLEREAVLGLFRPGAALPGGAALPAILLATDVAAEGLDLQRAERIVHVDLPWTSVRLDQREGRAVRMGSPVAEVEVVRLAPWPALEARLAAEARLLAKRRLAGHAGLDPSGHWLYRWRTTLADRVTGAATEPGMALVRGPDPGWLVGLALDLEHPNGTRWSEPAGLYWITPDGAVTDDAESVVARFESLSGATPLGITPAASAQAARLIVRLARSRVTRASESSWLSREAGSTQRRLVRRMRRVVVEAARQRNRALLSLGDQALSWLAGGVTAGEAALAEELVHTPRTRLVSSWRRLLARPRVRLVPVPRLTGLVGVCSFPACGPSGPCCSTSTAR